MRPLAWIAVSLLVVMSLYAFGVEQMRRQPRTPPIAGVTLPPPASDDPIGEIPPERRIRSGSGSAFLVDRGLWLTAGHVAQGCTGMAIFDGGDRGLRATIAWKHPGADLAFLNAGERAATLRFSRDPLVAGQDGFAIGFPKGNPGWVHGRLIERTRLRMRDVHSGDAPTLEWAEVGRSPSGLSALAGASGSPMLDERGHVVGVLVSSQRRRGRFTTTAPESLAPMAADGPRVIWAGRGSRSAAIDAASIDSVSERLRHARQVAIANCYVDK